MNTGTVIALGLLGIGGVTLLTMTHDNKPPAPNPAIDALAVAISSAEGAPKAWNNPGDLTRSFGYANKGPQNADGVLAFNTIEDGWGALYAELLLIQRGASIHSLSQTLADFGLSWSKGDPNWSVHVANKLGVTPDTPLGDVLA